MKRTPLFSAVVVFLFFLASCKNANQSGLSIPKDAAMVVHINTSSLSSKLSWDDIKKTEWFKDLHNDAHDSLTRKILDNPEASGINVKSDFAFFVRKRGHGGYGVFEGSIKNADDFEAFMKKTSHAEKVEKDGDWRMISQDSRSLVAWNNSKFAFISDMPVGGVNPMGRRGMDSEPMHFSADSLKIFVKDVMNLSSDESLFDDDRFASVMKDGGDMHFWVNSSSLYSEGMMGMLSVTKFGSLLEGNVSAGTLSFDDGKISIKAKQFYNKEMQKMIEKMKVKDVDAALLNRIPSDSVVGVIAMNIDPTSIKEVIKTVGVDGMANMFLNKFDLNLDEILSASKGEFLFAVSDVQMKDTTITFPSYNKNQQPFVYKTSRPDFNVLFATSVNQKETFNKLLNMIPQDSSRPLPFVYQLTNDWFAASNKPATKDAFLAGNTTKHEFTDKISGHPFGMYIDIQRLLRTNFVKMPMIKNLMTEAATVWKDFVAVGYEFKDGVATSEITINMVDTKTNSLKQLNQFIEKMNTARKKNSMVYDQDGDSDNTTTITTDSNNVVTPPPPPSPMDEKKH